MGLVRKMSIADSIREAYKRGQEDEALEPIIKTDAAGRPQGRLRQGDYVIFYDVRGEREVELTECLTAAEFRPFDRKKNLRLNFITMIQYDSSLPVRVAFPPVEKVRNTLAEVITRAGLPLVKIAESEKAPHIGYFFNGRNENPFAGEERLIVPSPQRVASYAQTPEMSAGLVADEVIARLRDRSCPVIVANLANVDVVGHIEDKQAVLRAIEAVDRALGRISAECRQQRVTLAVTSDHGTVEEWLYEDGSINTGHTRNPVPFILVTHHLSEADSLVLKESGELADVAPTVLDLLGLEKPPEMTGQSLILSPAQAGKRILLLILDGWGWRKEKEGNLILEAETPHFDSLWSRCPHCLLKASGETVGLPLQTVGNSEAGHLHLGAGRRISLDRVRIDQAIKDGSFFWNPVFLWAARGARENRRSLHLLGIVSHYSSHGSIDHLFALLRLAKEQGVRRVYIHAFIGRRGEKPESAAIYVEKVEQAARSIGVGEVVTVIGRHWALDREENWDRLEKAYRALVCGDGTKVGR
jgi:2,3-bisphosphoglycerate-independent phosphoglycerate mutase